MTNVRFPDEHPTAAIFFWFFPRGQCLVRRFGHGPRLNVPTIFVAVDPYI